MAEYLGINILTEGFLLPLAKMSLQVEVCAEMRSAIYLPHSAAGTFAEKLGNI